MIICQNDIEPIFRLYNRGENGQLKEYELVKTKSEKEFSVNKEYLFQKMKINLT